MWIAVFSREEVMLEVRVAHFLRRVEISGSQWQTLAVGRRVESRCNVDSYWTLEGKGIEMNRHFLSAPCLVALAVVATATRAQQVPHHFLARGNMRLANSESLWTGRFSDCDYRYYVLIPDGFVAHADRPPQRLHEVRFGLPDTSAADVVTLDDERIISVRARSNESEFKSLKGFADHVLDALGRGKSGFEVKEQQSSRLDGEPAMLLKVEYNSPDGRVLEEELLSLHLGVLYEIGLRTTSEHYDSDDKNFLKVVDGFKFWKDYRCYGTNNNP